MVLDFTPLQPLHLWLFGGSFGLVCVGIWLSQHYQGFLKTHEQRSNVQLAGSIVLAVITLVVVGLLPEFDNRHRLALLVAVGLIAYVGTQDEKHALAPFTQLLWQVGVAAVVVLGGWTISAVSHPFQSTVIGLAWYHWGPLIFPGSVLAVIWYVFLMNTVNWLDGVDGLATGVSLVTCVMLAAVSLLPSIQDSHTLALSLVGAGALLAFFIWNWSPAQVFLGTTGSWFIGLYLGLTAIMGGGKVITTLLILALPVIDVLLVILQRLWDRQPIWQGDTVRHWHHRLLASGYSPRIITLQAMIITGLLGAGALVLQTKEKIIALVMAAIFFGILAVVLAQSSYQTRHEN